MLPWQPKVYFMRDILTSIQLFSYMIHLSLDVCYSFRILFIKSETSPTICFEIGKGLRWFGKRDMVWEDVEAGYQDLV